MTGVDLSLSLTREPRRHWPRSVRSRVRDEWLAGMGTLAALAGRHGVPFGTVKRWHAAGQWRDLLAHLRDRTDEETMNKAAVSLDLQRQEHVQQVLSRARELYDQIDRAKENGSLRSVHAVVAMARALERVDRVFWGIFKRASSSAGARCCL